MSTGVCGDNGRMTITTDTPLLDTVEHETGASPQWSVLWLHGLGADGHDFAPLVPELVRPDWPALRRLLDETRPARLAVGEPYNADGSESPLTLAARGFAAELARFSSLPVDLIDERWSSQDAEERLRTMRASGQRQRRVTQADVDAAAAAVILERWFEKH